MAAIIFVGVFATLLWLIHCGAKEKDRCIIGRVYGILDHIKKKNFQDGLQIPQQLVLINFSFSIFPLPSDEVSALCDVF